MAKALLLEFLDDTIGQFVQDFDAENLSVGLWSGKIELKSLQLDINEINKEISLFSEDSPNLALPVRFLGGSIDKILLEVPWSNLSGKPLIFRVSGLKIVVEPFDHLSSTQRGDTQSHLDLRKEFLDRKEKRRNNLNKLRNMSLIDGAGIKRDSGDEKKKESSFTQKLIQLIIENLQLEIDDIQIEVKDDRFEVGLGLQSMSLLTTDHLGNKRFVDRSEEKSNKFVFKELELSNFNIYLDKKDKKFSSYQVKASHSNILEPLSFKAKLRKSDDEVVSLSVPKYQLNFELPLVSVNISKDHVDVLKMIQRIITKEDATISPLFPEYRPSVPISKKSAKLWWKYAVRSVGRLTHRTSWKEMFIAYNKRKKYILLYKRYAHHLSLPNYAPLSVLEERELLNIDYDRTISVKAIMLWRNFADATAELEKEKAQKSKKSPKKFKVTLFKKKKSSKKDKDDSIIPLSFEDLKALSLDDDNPTSSVIDNFKVFDLSFVIGEVYISLMESLTKPFLFLQISTLKTEFEANVDGSFEFKQILDEFLVNDLSYADPLFRQIVKTSTSSADILEKSDLRLLDQKSHVCDINLHNSKDGSIDIKINIRSFEIALHPFLLNKIKGSFFDDNEKEDEIIKTSQNVSSKFKRTSEKRSDKLYSSVANIIEQRRNKKASINLTMDINAPIVLLPLSAIDKNTDIIVLDLGSFKANFGSIAVPSPYLRSWFQQKEEIESSKSVDYFSIEINDISLELCKASDSKLEAETLYGKLCKVEQIILPISLSLCFGIGNAKAITGKICAAVTIDEIGINLSANKINRLTCILTLWRFTLGQRNNKIIHENSESNDIIVNNETVIKVIEEPDTIKSDLSLTDNDLEEDSEHGISENLHLSVCLNHLHIALENQKLEKIESEIANVSTSLVFHDDNSSTISFKMGSFWIFDGLGEEQIRQQRLLAHSGLPIDNVSFGKNNKINQRSRLNQTVDPLNNSVQESNLAEIMIKSYPKHGDIDQYNKSQRPQAFTTVIDMEFFRLCLIFNPIATHKVSCFLETLKDNYFNAIREMNSDAKIEKSVIHSDNNITIALREKMKKSATSLSINACLSSLDVCMRSGKTDDELLNVQIFDIGANYSQIEQEDGLIKNFESLIQDFSCETIAMDFVSTPIQLFGPISALEDEKTTQDNVLSLNVKMTDNQLRVDVTIGELEQLIFPELQDILNRFLDSFPKRIVPSKDEAVTAPKKTSQRNESDTETTSLFWVVQKTNVSLRIEKYRLKLFGLPQGIERTLTSRKSDGFLFSEGVIMETACQISVYTNQNTQTKTIRHSSLEINLEGIEIYTSEGTNGDYLIQILDPVGCSLKCTYLERRKLLLDIGIKVLSRFSFDISIQNIALFHRLFTSFDKLNKSTSQQKLKESSTYRELSKSKKESILLKVSIPESKFTVMNDLLGSDNALFKIMFDETVFEVEVLSLHSNLTDLDDMMFYVKLETNLSAEYFHTVMNMWEPLLLEPCKIKLSCSRGNNNEANTSRLYTSVGIELNSFHLLFSEQFLTNIGSARRMWLVYSGATSKLFNEFDDDLDTFENDLFQTYSRRSFAHHMIRSLLSLHPYEIHNVTTRDVHFQVKNNVSKDFCGTLGKCGFKFELRQGEGHGGKRFYGQDSDELKSVTIHFGDTEIYFDHVDKELNKLAYPHHLGMNKFVFTQVEKIGTRTRITLRTPVKITNCTGIPFEVYVGDNILLGSIGKQSNKRVDLDKGQSSSSCLGIPASYLNLELNADSNLVTISVKPKMIGHDTTDTSGKVNIPSLQDIRHLLKTGCDWTINEIRCSPIEMVFQVFCRFSLVRNNQILVDVFIQPRVIFQNLMPINIFIQVNQGFVFPTVTENSMKTTNDLSYEIEPLGTIELFSPFYEVCMNIRISGIYADGNHLGSLKLSELSTSAEETKTDKNDLYFSVPLVDQNENILYEKGAICLISEVKNIYSSRDRSKTRKAKFENASIDLPHNFVAEDAVNTFQLKVPNIAVDHTCNVLIKPVDSDVLTTIRDGFRRKLPPTSTYSAFWSPTYNQKITLLPNSKDQIRIAIKDRSGIHGISSSPFSIENIVLKEGGVDFSRIPMENTSRTAIYAFRKLSSYYNNELHIVNEYSIFNSSNSIWVSVIFEGGSKMTIIPNSTAPLIETENVRFQIIGSNYETDPINIRLGTKIHTLKSKPFGDSVGSISIETTLAEVSSRFVVKIGKIGLNDDSDSNSTASEKLKNSLFNEDILRFSFKLQKLQVSLCRSKSNLDRENDTDNNILREILKKESRVKFAKGEGNEDDIFKLYTRVAHILFDGILIDYQRMFKVVAMNQSESKPTPHTQLVCVISKVVLIDHTPNTTYPLVLHTDNTNSNLFKLVVQAKEDNEMKYIDVELIDLKICHNDSGLSDGIIFCTSEQFVWNLLDMSTNILSTVSEINSFQVKLSPNKENKLTASVESLTEDNHSFMYCSEEVFTASSSKRKLKIKKAIISPISFKISFKRHPDASRYKDMVGARFVNYFIKSMKFTITNANVSFPGYILHEFKGSSDEFFSIIKKFYRSEASYQLITLLSAASLEEWDTLTGRQDGKSEYVEGDELRMVGNLLGKTANFLLQGTGEGIGTGIDFLATTIGGGIKVGATIVGAEDAGEGVDEALTGAGKGVSDTVRGVGSASGKVLHGVGKGIGSAAGGVGGGLLLAVQGKVNEGTQSASEGFGTGLEAVTKEVGEGAKEVSDSTSSASRKCCIGCSRSCQVS